MDQELERYLNDHLAGASGALQLIQHLIETLDEPEAREFFVQLKADITGDRALLENLIISAGLETSAVLKATGAVAAKFGYLKLKWEGFEPGGLGIFEALEMLALGIQGKRLLWVALKEIACWIPEWNDRNFGNLELEAIRQRDGVELWRIEAALDTRASTERRRRNGKKA